MSSADRVNDAGVSDDVKLRMFLDLVDCDEAEVKNIPPGRPLTTEELKAECDRVDPEARRRSLGEMRLFFGEHKGKKLNEMPESYLEWIVSTPSKKRWFKKLQPKIREYLGMPAAPSKKRKARLQKLGFMSELDREYLAIIGKAEPPPKIESAGTAEPANQVRPVRATSRRNGKKNTSHQEPRPRRRTVHVACTRCDYEERMDKVDFAYAARRAARCRCPECGGNVVRARFVDRFQKD